jgi:hypothetical protein
LLPALINIFLLTFWSHKTCYKSFAIPIAYTGYDGCPSHHRFPQAKLIFPLDLPKKHQPLSSSRSPWNSHTSSLTPFRPFLHMFLLLHFLLAQKLLEGFCRDSSDSSICSLPISSWPPNNPLLSFLEHMSLFLLIIEDGTCNVSFRLVNRALLFPSGLLHYYHHDFCSHPHTDLSFTKKLKRKKSSVINLKSAKIKCFLRFWIAKFHPNWKKNRQISLHGFQVGSQK